MTAGGANPGGRATRSHRHTHKLALRKSWGFVDVKIPCDDVVLLKQFGKILPNPRHTLINYRILSDLNHTWAVKILQ